MWFWAERSDNLKSSLTPAHWALVVVLVSLPLVLVILNIGPGRWINEAQDSVIGGHSIEWSVLMVLLLEFLLIGVTG
jgi:hypothetical protein